MNKLKVVAVDARSRQSVRSTTRSGKRQEAKARLERHWLLSPTDFNPDRHARERQRVARLKRLIHSLTPLKGRRIADLGCGTGWLTEYLLREGAEVHAVDIASNALRNLCPAPSLTPIQATLPHTDLPDDYFDLVIGADIIAELPSEDYRLMMAEFYRIVHPKGLVLCSTKVDIYSSNALDRLESLVGIELEPIQFHYQYHSWSIKIESFLRRIGLKSWADHWAQQDALLLMSEKLNKITRRRRGISHATIVAKRRNAFPTIEG